MQEIIELLQNELELAGRIKELAQQQQKVLADQRGGSAAGQLAEQLMQKMTELSAATGKQELILKNRGCRSLGELVEKQPESAERQQAEEKLQSLQMELKELERISAVSKKLLAKNMEFAGFTINVLNQVAADVTYAPQGASGPEPLRGKKMFDQSV